MSEWKDSDGKDITLEEIVDACFLASSVLAKEIEFNDKIKGTPAFLENYKRALEVLSVVKKKFDGVLMQMRMKNIKKTIPRGKK